jgi:hypothetical protein
MPGSVRRGNIEAKSIMRYYRASFRIESSKPARIA